MDDVASGCVKYLTTFSDLTGLLGSFPASDPNASFASRPWLFKDDRLVRTEGQSVSLGTRAVAVVCSDYGGWGVPPALTTPRFSRLSVEFYVDPLRDASHQITETAGATRQRGKAVFTAAQVRLHRTSPDAVLWGDLRTVGCELLTEPQFLPDPDSDGGQRGQAFYGVLWFGTTDTPG